jgi:hypothetical protein
MFQSFCSGCAATLVGASSAGDKDVALIDWEWEIFR